MRNAMIAIEEDTATTMVQNRENVVWAPAPALRPEWADALPPSIRGGRVLRIRRQLAEGKYDVDGRLSAAIDRFLESLIGKAMAGPTRAKTSVSNLLLI
jgi:hypothetical protein